MYQTVPQKLVLSVSIPTLTAFLAGFKTFAHVSNHGWTRTSVQVPAPDYSPTRARYNNNKDTTV
jgi:hypothetical protein